MAKRFFTDSLRTAGISIGALFLLTSAGCMTVGPDFERPAINVPDTWNSVLVQEFKSGDPAVASWWKVFGDETLNAVIEKATEGNLDLKVASSRVLESRAQLGFARGEHLPDLDVNGLAGWTRSSEETVPFLPEELEREDSLFQAGASVGWELDLWGRIRRSVESATAAYESTIEDYRDVLVLLYADAASTYFDVRALQLRVRLAEANATTQKGTLQLTKDRNMAGLVPELDVRQAELNLATTVATIPQLRSLLVRAMNRLSVLTGQEPAALHEMLGSAHDVPVPPENIAVGIPVNIVRQRPDVRRAERNLAAQHARIGVAKGDLYPTFTLPGSFTLEAPDAGDVFDGGALTYRFGPSLRWNIFSGGRIRNAVRVEEARTLQANHQYEKAVLRALEEVENAMVSVVEERKRNDALYAAVLAAEASVELVDVLYRSGLTDFQNVLDAQRSLTLQQDNHALSEGQLGKNYSQLYKALGGGWNTTK